MGNSVGSKVKGSVTVDHGCKSSDQYGSNDCEMDWGSTYNVTYNIECDEDLNSKTNLDVKLTLDGLIPFHISCAICGVDCTFTIPIVKKKVIIPFSKVPCPIKAGKNSNTVSVTLPAKDPVPIKVSFKGEAKITDDSGAELGDISITGSVAS